MALTAVPAANVVTLSPGIEYVAGAIRIDHAKSVGLGSCSGCSEPVCIVFRSLEVEAVNTAADQLLQLGANGIDSQFVHWQQAQIQNLQLNCFPGHPCELTYSCVHSVVTPTRGSTWGAVKALYR